MCDGKRPPALFLNMSPLNRRKIQSAVDYRLNPVMVVKNDLCCQQIRLRPCTTVCSGCVQSIKHQNVQNANAVLIDSIGLTIATVEVAEKIGLKFSSAVLWMLKKIQRDLDYHQWNRKHGSLSGQGPVETCKAEN